MAIIMCGLIWDSIYSGLIEVIKPSEEMVNFTAMKNLLKFSLLFLFLIQSCSKETWLSGTMDLEGGEDWKPMVYLVVPEKFDAVAQSFVGKVLDSAQVDEAGCFEFKSPPELQAPVLLELFGSLWPPLSPWGHPPPLPPRGPPCAACRSPLVVSPC